MADDGTELPDRHVPSGLLADRYFAGRADDLRPSTGKDLLVATLSQLPVAGIPRLVPFLDGLQGMSRLIRGLVRAEPVLPGAALVVLHGHVPEAEPPAVLVITHDN